MKLKPGVKWPAEMAPSMWYARAVIDQLHREKTGVGATCTSAFRPGDPKLHGSKEALDVRIWAFPTNEDVRAFARDARDRLGPDFDVVIEGPAAENPAYLDRAPHIHVEHDPKEWAS